MCGSRKTIFARNVYQKYNLKILFWINFTKLTHSDSSKYFLFYGN